MSYSISFFAHQATDADAVDVADAAAVSADVSGDADIAADAVDADEVGYMVYWVIYDLNRTIV